MGKIPTDFIIMSGVSHKTDTLVSKLCKTILNLSRESYFVYLFNFLYYLCISPFKFQKRGFDSSSHYILKSFKPQQLICVCVTILSLCDAWAYIITVMQTVNILEGDVSQLMEMAACLASALAVTSLQLIFWVMPSRVLEFVNAFSNTDDLQKSLDIKGYLVTQFY